MTKQRNQFLYLIPIDEKISMYAENLYERLRIGSNGGWARTRARVCACV